jgi:hypothetical protein
MIDLKELIERELVSFLEWPSDHKGSVTTTSAKLFAEHVARLYADHIPEATKKIGRPQIREVFMRNGARIEPGHDDLPDYVYESVFELMELAAPAVQKPAPDAAGLVEALVAILEHDSPINIVDTATATERDIFDIARAALTAHRKGGGA